ncbi:DEAD/DEAH box helicase [Xylella fastidiosa]|uniref:DNA 3'-5' helicase II n=1 Tax=Xylella fastidiosa subsp. sandyi Ann-1 TaxID=155920 RepID=A0A060H6J8_XYLFS|nr:ATP-binding domain-containing protein [Xylella fastidiosa]AIC10900.1 helicase [Xylella fastidiosa subsp. sandyi Ann-1]UIX81243.1 ATP-binding domain-containing protein [Xylella fastidiosa subsp. sandyi]
MSVISFAPAIGNVEAVAITDYPLVNEDGLGAALNALDWTQGSDTLYRMTLSAIESLSSIRKSRSKREVQRSDSRGAKLKRLEDSIATLDHRQHKAVLETVEGVQRIRGLAGSGKTIVLALKAAYLHTQYPDWRIAVTFNTRSLKAQFQRLITNFCIEQSGEEPDWTKIRIINAWGAPGGAARDGLYYEYCCATGATFFDFRRASFTFVNEENAFNGACRNALEDAADAAGLYDVILLDEAQDLPPSFLKLCYAMLTPEKRLVYAYDELQNLSGTSLPPPEEIFGKDETGKPLVTFGDDDRRDLILQKCYRNSRPVLVSAHSLGFGMYRNVPQNAHTGLVQMFNDPMLWEEIGYTVKHGQLAKGQPVALERTPETSPIFLEDHSNINDIVQFIPFEDEWQQAVWLVQQIQKNIAEDELRHDDIMVIHPDSLTARQSTGFIRKSLFEAGIQAHLAGVDTDADVFFRTDTRSVTFTGIYRAKGNEAGMVYVINAQHCNGSSSGLAKLRNCLFTAMTRSKAWVRVIGYGPKMQELVDEFNALKQRNFVLEFTYPDEELLSKLRIVRSEVSPQEQKRTEKTNRQFVDVVRALESGKVHVENLDAASLETLRKFLKDNAS